MNMYQDSSGELHAIMPDRIVAISSSRDSLTPNDLVIKTIASHGTNNPVVVRTSLQADHILGASKIGADPKASALVKGIVATYRDRLLNMCDCYNYIYKEILRCDKEFNNSIRPLQLPQVQDLKPKVEGFLLDGKRTVSEISQLFAVFFGHTKVGHNYDEHLSWAQTRFGKTSFITKVLEDNTSGDRWIEYFCELRNRVEHPRANYWLKIQNIEFSNAVQKMTTPGLVTESASAVDLLYQMGAMINNALFLNEDLLGSCVSETLSVPSCTAVAPIPSDQITQNLPFRWRIFVTRPTK